MQINSSTITFVIIIFVSLILLSKYLSKIFLLLLDNLFSKKKVPKNHFENLILQKKNILRSNSLNNSKPSIFQQENNDPKENKDKKQRRELSFLEVLYHQARLQQGVELLYLQKFIVEKSNFRISTESIIQIIMSIKEDKNLNKTLLCQNRKIIKETVLNLFFLNELQNIFFSKKTFLTNEQFIFKIVKKSLPVREKFVKKIIYLFFLHSKQEIKHQKIEQSLCLELLLKRQRKIETFNQTIIKKLKFSYQQNLSFFIKCYNIIDLCDKLDNFKQTSADSQKIALSYLEIQQMPKNKNELKSLYKKVLLKRHPDKISILRINNYYLSNINHNFQQIQLAYDFLLKKL